MLVDINLIPKVEKKVKTVQIITIITALSFALILTSFIYLHFQAENNAKLLEKELNGILVSKAELESLLIEQPIATGVNEEVIMKLLDEKVLALSIFEPYVQQLPPNGSIITLDYNQAGTVGLQIKLASFNQIATYISNIEGMDSVDKVELIQVSSTEEDTKRSYIISLEVSYINKKQAGA